MHRTSSTVLYSVYYVGVVFPVGNGFENIWVGGALRWKGSNERRKTKRYSSTSSSRISNT